MWIFMSDSFLSVVENKDDPSLLHVRARKRDDLKLLFPKAHITKTPEGDYPFRCDVDRQDFAEVIVDQILDISYTNFKGSVRDGRRHDAYMDVWTAMRAWQRD